MRPPRVLQREQLVPRPPEDLFAFFAEARNLEDLTPGHLRFTVVTPDPIAIEEGALIDYRLRLFGVPFAWRTRIEDWTPGRSFTDAQLRGPFRAWRHTHELEPAPGGTLMRDTVRYEMPLGPFGAIVHALLVRPILERIFDFRRDRIATRFGGEAPAASTGRAGSLALLAASAAAVLLVAALGGALTAHGLGPWYDGLPKPAWQPPAWVFGPVWTALYGLQAVAAWLVARAGWSAPGVRRALALHGLQLLLQVAWSGTFFALRAPGAAVGVIAAVGVALALTAAAFLRVRPLAAALLAPTLAWVGFATALNVAIALAGRSGGP